MKGLHRIVLALSLAATEPGCTTLLIEKQGKPKSANTASCPRIYSLTRMDVAALDWVFSDDPRPADACLALSYPNAGKDTLYQTSTRAMSPLIMMGLPVSVMVDTLTLPFSALAAN